MRNFVLSLLIALCGLQAPCAHGEDAPSKPLWITGEVFTEKHVLFFRADGPVPNNTTGRVVVLAAVREGKDTLLPFYFKAAEKRIRLRLYGDLRPFSGSFPGYSAPLPSLVFVTWKVHTPDDPDELPAGTAINPKPDDGLEGVKVEKVEPKR